MIDFFSDQVHALSAVVVFYFLCHRILLLSSQDINVFMRLSYWFIGTDFYLQLTECWSFHWLLTDLFPLFPSQIILILYLSFGTFWSKPYLPSFILFWSTGTVSAQLFHLAEKWGFEPQIRQGGYTISSRAHSTTLPLLHASTRRI